MIRGLPHPRRVKLNHKPIVRPYVYHHTTLHLQITWRASLGYTVRGRVRGDGTTVMCSVESLVLKVYAVVSIMHVAVRFDLLFYMSLSGSCNEK